MINMMYLVFIAMLALQISKEVLATLGILSEDMEKSTAELETSIDSAYNIINQNSNQDYYKIPSEELPKLKEITDEYVNFLQSLKDSLIGIDDNNFMIDVEYVDDNGNEKISQRIDYQVMDKSNYLDEIFFINDGVTTKGQEFIDYFNLPAVSTLMGLGAVDTQHQSSLHMLGMHGTPFANYAVQESDFLIAIGSRFDDRVAGVPEKFAPEAKVIAHFDVDPSEYAQDSGEDDLLVSSFIFKEARERKDLNVESLFYHRLEDTSMEADFSSGDLIIIEKNKYILRYFQVCS